MTHPIYLDNHATTRIDDRVLAAMLPFYTEEYGNAASRQHEFGWRAEAAVEKARREVAELIGARPTEIFFTSGATESNNLALKGLVEAYAPVRQHIITATTEHSSVLDTCARLEEYGCSVTRLPVDSNGLVDPDAVRGAITPKTLAVSIMLANNEIGTIAPATDIGRICREAGVLFHSDATQAMPFLPVHVRETAIDLLSLSAHKFHGPKGIGVLYIRDGLRLAAQMDGGGHERGRRSGTLNVPAIAGLGAAARIVREERPAYAPKVKELRDQFSALLLAECGEVTMNGHPALRLPNNLSATFLGVRADRLMMEVRTVAMATGSACSSASPEPSHVLRAIGLDREAIGGTIRFGLSRFTTGEEIGAAAAAISDGVHKLRSGHRVAAART